MYQQYKLLEKVRNSILIFYVYYLCHFETCVTKGHIVYIYTTAVSVNLISLTTNLLTWYLHGVNEPTHFSLLVSLRRPTITQVSLLIQAGSLAPSLLADTK